MVPVGDVEDFMYVRTTCRVAQRAVPGARRARGLAAGVEYTGGKAPVAAALGLEEFDFGVYQGWAPASDVSEREYRV